MSRVTQDSFVNSGARIDLKDLDPEGVTGLAKSGLDAAALARVAGEDGVISGKSERKELFGLIDRLDNDSSRRSIATMTKDASGREVATPSGQALSALKEEVAEARLQNQLGGPATRPAKAGLDQGGHDPDSRGALPNDPPWLRTAFGERGVQEGAKDATNPRILEYFDGTYQKGQHADDSGKKNAWCAAFVTFTLAENGIKNNKAVGAREYENWGEPSEPFRGAVVVLQHGKQKHVAILAGVDEKGNNVFLGGNQNNRVSLSDLPGYEVLAIRKPRGYEVPAELQKLPTLANASSGSVTTR